MRQTNVGLSFSQRKILGLNYAHVLQSIATLRICCPRTGARAVSCDLFQIYHINSLTLSFIATSSMYADRFMSGIDLLNMVSQARMASFLKPVWLTNAGVGFMWLATNANFKFFLHSCGMWYVIRMALHADDASLGRSARSLCVLRILFQVAETNFLYIPFFISFFSDPCQQNLSHSSASIYDIKARTCNGPLSRAKIVIWWISTRVIWWISTKSYMMN